MRAKAPTKASPAPVKSTVSALPCVTMTAFTPAASHSAAQDSIARRASPEKLCASASASNSLTINTSTSVCSRWEKSAAGDRVGPAVLDEDDRDARRCVRIAEHEGSVDACPVESGDKFRSSIIPAHARHHLDVGTEPRGGECLVATLAAAQADEVPAETVSPAPGSRRTGPPNPR